MCFISRKKALVAGRNYTKQYIQIVITFFIIKFEMDEITTPS